MDSKHHDLNVCVSLLSCFTFRCMELSYNRPVPWSRNILNKVTEVYVMQKLCEVSAVRGFVVAFINTPNGPLLKQN
jgi:hypothetical protein